MNLINLYGFNEIGKDIYVYKQFLSNEELLNINNEIYLKGSSLWRTNKSSNSLDSVSIISEKIKKIVNDPYFIRNQTSINRLVLGESWGLHSDNHEFLNLRKESLSLKDGEDFRLEDNNLFGIVCYINDFDGGELNYPHQSITYKPEAGDLVVHSSEDHCAHEVLEVKSETRYSYSNAIYEKIKVPIN